MSAETLKPTTIPDPSAEQGQQLTLDMTGAAYNMGTGEPTPGETPLEQPTPGELEGQQTLDLGSVSKPYQPRLELPGESSVLPLASQEMWDDTINQETPASQPEKAGKLREMFHRAGNLALRGAVALTVRNMAKTEAPTPAVRRQPRGTQLKFELKTDKQLRQEASYNYEKGLNARAREGLKDRHFARKVEVMKRVHDDYASLSDLDMARTLLRKQDTEETAKRNQAEAAKRQKEALQAQKLQERTIAFGQELEKRYKDRVENYEDLSGDEKITKLMELADADYQRFRNRRAMHQKLGQQLTEKLGTELGAKASGKDALASLTDDRYNHFVEMWRHQDHEEGRKKRPETDTNVSGSSDTKPKDTGKNSGGGRKPAKNSVKPGSPRPVPATPPPGYKPKQPAS